MTIPLHPAPAKDTPAFQEPPPPPPVLTVPLHQVVPPFPPAHHPNVAVQGVGAVQEPHPPHHQAY